MKRFLAVLLTTVLFWTNSLAADAFAPVATCEYVVRDTCTLYLDIYAPTAGSATTVDGKAKPAVLFAFGGGFVSGSRNESYYLPWFKRLTEAGYPVVSIDYRLGLKGFHGAGMNKAFVLATKNAIDMAVDDLYSATLWLLEHGEAYGIDAHNMVISGSSAGAITVMQAEYELSNRTERASVLPADFNFAGVMSFAGAVYTLHGTPKYKSEPCPTLLLQGMEDKIVTYRKIAIGPVFFGGLKPLAKVFRKNGYNYNAFHFVAHAHEIANNMVLSFPEEMRFLETNVVRGQKRIIDTKVDDPDIPFPDWGKGGYAGLYK